MASVASALKAGQVSTALSLYVGQNVCTGPACIRTFVSVTRAGKVRYATLGSAQPALTVFAVAPKSVNASTDMRGSTAIFPSVRLHVFMDTQLRRTYATVTRDGMEESVTKLYVQMSAETMATVSCRSIVSVIQPGTRAMSRLNATYSIR